MREIRDEAGRRWSAVQISHGRTSGYLNRRVHRAIVEFACQDATEPRKYGTLAVGKDLDAISEAELLEMLRNARPH